MLFYAICVLIAIIAAALVLRPLWLSPAATDGNGDEPRDVAFYRAQIREIDRDLARGTLAPEEAERTRTEIARRLLTADKAGTPEINAAPRRLTRSVALATAAIITICGGVFYWWAGVPGYPDLPLKARLSASEQAREDRLSQADMVDRLPPAPVRGSVPEDYREMVEQLRSAAEGRPDDLEGQQLLARHEAQLGNYDAAIVAQRNVLRLKGETATAQDKLLLVDLMVFQVQGFVSPESEQLAREILDREPGNIGARYYIGLLYDETDRPDVAFRLWREIVESGSTEPHAMMALRMIEQAASRAGIDYTLPDAPTAPGPSAEDVEAAADMDPEARAAMIEGMVAQLNDRLAREGGTAEDWARLIGALNVLGQNDRAAAILAEGRHRFADQPDGLQTLNAAAAQAGLE